MKVSTQTIEESNGAPEVGDRLTAPAVIDFILQTVVEEGFVHIQKSVSLVDYERLVREVGVVVSRSDIRLDPDRVRLQQTTRKIKERPSAYRPEALSFHSDNPTVDLLSWYCVEQDKEDGAVLLLDTSDLIDNFSPSQLEELSAIRIWFSDRIQDTEEEKLTEIPILSRTASGYAVYYQPWLFSQDMAPETVSLLDEFAAYLRRKRDSELIRIQISPGECLFIDNHRMLHGRAALTENSKRHLVRCFIRTRCNWVS
ncbi:MAG: TauD/TfdA family dioxygenase [Blastocatellia bacterium]